MTELIQLSNVYARRVIHRLDSRFARLVPKRRAVLALRSFECHDCLQKNQNFYNVKYPRGPALVPPRPVRNAATVIVTHNRCLFVA